MKSIRKILGGGDIGVQRQVREARNQASNEKAKRMHWTLLNMVRSMICASRLSLSFWLSMHIYFQSQPDKRNQIRALPMEVLTKRASRMNSLAKRSQVDVIIGRGSQTVIS